MAAEPRLVRIALEVEAVADPHRLCRELGRLLEASGARRVVADVSALAASGASVDALARCQLTAKRHGCGFVLEGASGALLDLLDLSGLREAIPPVR
jgi:hypothetical protein